MATQMMLNLATQGHKVLYISLDNTRANIERDLVAQKFDLSLTQAKNLIMTDQARASAALENISIVENLTSLTNNAPPATPEWVQEKIEMIKPQAVFVDHLGLMAASAAIRNSLSPAQYSGYITQELSKVAKTTNTYVQVLQNLPKAAPVGQEIPYDAARGGGKQADYCDYIYCIWRPEDEADLDVDEKRERLGQYKIKLSKNRHGPQGLAHLVLDKRSKRIIQSRPVG
jgi:replicative DNA helicase